MKQTPVSAGIIPIFVERSPQFLLLRAYNYWDFPKGLVERGEDLKTAALRELHEETGLSSVEFRWGDDFIETEPYSRGKVAKYFLAATKTRNVVLGINEQLGRPEHSEFRWLTYEEAKGLLVPRLQIVLTRAQKIIEGHKIAAPQS